MSFLRYLKDHVASLVLAVLACVLVWVILTGLGVVEGASRLILSVLVTAEVAKVLVDYGRQRTFWRRLRLLSERDDTLDVVDTIDEPPFSTGRAAVDALDSVSRDAHARVNDSIQTGEEYRSYIEAWVHEVKTPIAAARLVTDNNPGPQSSALSVELDRIDGYVEQALYYARSASVDRDYVVRPCELRELVSSSVRSQARYLIGCGVAVRMGELDERVLCDAKWMSFVLGQLIQNAAKYRADPASGRTSAISFEARRKGEGTARERVVLVVSDNGCGIPAADVDRVFDKGFVGDNGRRDEQTKSTGLGLYLVRRLCDKMGVGVSLSSVEGESTTVALTFSANRMHYLLQEDEK